jgi:hypothetical protein
MARRSGSAATIATRSASLASGQRVISSTVRAQPAHQPLRRSMVQTLLQGEATGMMA